MPLTKPGPEAVLRGARYMARGLQPFNGVGPIMTESLEVRVPPLKVLGIDIFDNPANRPLSFCD